MRYIAYFVVILGVSAKPPSFYECALVNNNECSSFNFGICCQIFPYNSDAYTNCMGYCVNTPGDIGICSYLTDSFCKPQDLGNADKIDSLCCRENFENCCTGIPNSEDSLYFSQCIKKACSVQQGRRPRSFLDVFLNVINEIMFRPFGYELRQ